MKLSGSCDLANRGDRDGLGVYRLGLIRRWHGDAGLRNGIGDGVFRFGGIRTRFISDPLCGSANLRIFAPAGIETWYARLAVSSRRKWGSGPNRCRDCIGRAHRLRARCAPSRRRPILGYRCRDFGVRAPDWRVGACLIVGSDEAHRKLVYGPPSPAHGVTRPRRCRDEAPRLVRAHPPPK